MEELVYLNGVLVARGEARISPFDRGILYGYGLFETMRSYGGRVFRLDRHLARLMRSAEKLSLAAALDPVELEQAIYKTLEANKLPDARISKKEMDKIHASLELLRCSQCHGADQLRQLAIKSPAERMRIVREMIAKPGSRLTPDEVTRVLRAYEQMVGF